MSRSNYAHQLSGTASSDLGSQVVCQAQVQDLNTAEDRQHHSSSIYKQSGRHRLQRTCPTDEESLDVVPGEEYTHNSTVPSRISECNSRCRVSGGNQQDRLEAEPSNICKIDHLFSPLEVVLFATRLSTQCQRYLSWQQDPYAEATDAFLQNWTHLKGYANPPWNLIGKAISQV